MLKKLQGLGIVCVVLTSCFWSPQGAQNSEWKVLFDGKSTSEWRGFKQPGFPTGSWVIEEGALKTVGGAERIDIVTRDQYENFELELEWKVSPGGNSGIFYLASEEPRMIWATAPELQVLDDGGHRDGQNPKTSAGSLYALIAPMNKELRPVGEYNHFRLVLQGGHVEHWLNGKKVVSYELGTEELQRLIAESKFKDMPRFAQEKRGSIGLQHHGQEVWFRNIRIRELAAAPNQLTDAEKAAGWKLLFDGKTTTGWKGFKKESFPAHRWAVEDGSLVRKKGGTEKDPITGGGGNDIITIEKFDDFELKLEWAISPGGNSGLKYFIAEERQGAIGHEYQIIDDQGYRSKLTDLHKPAGLYDLLPAGNPVTKPAGEFNETRVVVLGNRVEHWLNGVKVLEYQLGSPELKAAIAKSKFKEVVGFGSKFKTPILLQDHGDEVRFRTIKIRELSLH